MVTIGGSTSSRRSAKAAIENIVERGVLKVQLRFVTIEFTHVKIMSCHDCIPWISGLERRDRNRDSQFEADTRHNFDAPSPRSNSLNHQMQDMHIGATSPDQNNSWSKPRNDRAGALIDDNSDDATTIYVDSQFLGKIIGKAERSYDVHLWKLLYFVNFLGSGGSRIKEIQSDAGVKIKVRQLCKHSFLFIY